MDPPSPEASSFAKATADESARQARESELDLVARLRAGDEEAFEAVYAAFNARLFNFLARLCRRRDVAEDLLEETWLRVVQARRRCATTRGWGRSSSPSRATCMSATAGPDRSRISTRRVSLGLWPSGSPGPSPFEATIARETGERIDAALAALPAVYREALLLVALEGMPPAKPPSSAAFLQRRCVSGSAAPAR